MKPNSRIVGFGIAVSLCCALALTTQAQQGRVPDPGKPMGVPGGGYAGYDPSRPITVKVVPGGIQADLRNGAVMNTVMDAASLKVTVSPSMTTFSDAKGHRWTLYAGKRRAAGAERPSDPKPQNLIAGGDFEGDSTRIGTDYELGGDLQNPQACAVANSPHDCHPGGADFGDHTTGHGHMLVANGGADAGSCVWRQTVPVKPHGVYRFTGWAASWAMWDGPSDDSPARLRVTVNGRPVVAAFTVPAQDGIWAHFTGTWAAGADGKAVIQMTDLNTDGFGNDFALDDLSLTAVPSQASPKRPAPKQGR